jgi:hypothetical protein
MKLQSDITEYLSATSAQQEIYAQIGTDETKARAMRPQRWAAMTRRREAAENLIMSVLGQFRASLANAGLVEFYESMAAGKEMPETVFKIADATAKHYGKKTLPL